MPGADIATSSGTVQIEVEPRKPGHQVPGREGNSRFEGLSAAVAEPPRSQACRRGTITSAYFGLLFLLVSVCGDLGRLLFDLKAKYKRSVLVPTPIFSMALYL